MLACNDFAEATQLTWGTKALVEAEMAWPESGNRYEQSEWKYRYELHHLKSVQKVVQ